MYQLPRRAVLYWLRQTLTLKLLLNIAACSCDQNTIPPVSAISMQILTPQLIGGQKEIKVYFDIGNPTLLDNYQLRITVVEQKTMTTKDIVAESQITYKNAVGTLLNFSNTYTGGLSEFINPHGLKAGQKPQVNFNLAPPDQVVKLKLKFELLQSEHGHQIDSIQNITVEWVIKEIIFNVVSDEKGTFLTIQSLKEDIKDLYKTILNVASIGDNISFLVEGKKMEVASLAQLLPHQQILYKDQASPRIPLMVEPKEISSGVGEVPPPPIFSVSVSQAASKTTASEVTPPDHPDTIKVKVSQIEKLREKEEANEAQLTKLQNEQETIKQEQQQVSKKLRKEGARLKEIKDKAIKELEKQEAKELEGKDKAVQKDIHKKYKQQKEEVLALDDKVVSKHLEYAKGLLNGYAHNMVGVTLKNAKNENFYKGQQAGLKVSFGSAGVESAIGAALVSGGVFTILFSGGLSLPFSVAMIILGAALVAHAVFAGARGQNNYIQRSSPE